MILYVFCGVFNEAFNRLNNSVLEDRGVLQVHFGANKTSIEVIREGAFWGTYFRDIYCRVNEKWYKKSCKEFDQKYHCSS